MSEALVPLSMILPAKRKLSEVPIGEEVGVDSRSITVIGKGEEYKMYMYTDTRVGEFDPGPVSLSEDNATSSIGDMLMRHVADDVVGVTRVTRNYVSVRVPTGTTFRTEPEHSGGASEGHHIILVAKIEHFTRPEK